MAETIADRVHEVVRRVLNDGAFALELRRAGIAAVRAGAGSEAFRRYFEYFAATPGELSEMGSPDSPGCTCNSNTWFTLSSIVGPLYTCCAGTTTTTTSGGFFDR